MTEYVRIRSWHIAGVIRHRTLCGRRAKSDSERSIGLPLGEKSCESCLRFAAKRGWE